MLTLPQARQAEKRLGQRAHSGGGLPGNRSAGGWGVAAFTRPEESRRGLDTGYPGSLWSKMQRLAYALGLWVT